MTGEVSGLESKAAAENFSAAFQFIKSDSRLNLNRNSTLLIAS